MIKLIDRGTKDCLIEFSPRPTKGGSSITRELIYGHMCPWCSNVIQALFLTKEEVKLDNYEQTRVLSQGDKNDGMLRKYIPNSEEPASGYRSDFYCTPKGNAQLIRLKNHLALFKGLGSGADRDEAYEVGERCCKYIGLFSRNPERLPADLMLLLSPGQVQTTRDAGITVDFLDAWTAPDWQKFDYRIVPAVGDAGPVVIVPRNLIKETDSYRFGMMIEAWKQYSAAKAAA